MGEYPDFRTPDREQPRRSTDATEPLLSKQGQQEIAHERGRICKKRGCVVCAPLVERRRLKKTQRKAEAQALLHAKGQPCGRSSCALAVCVDARNVASPPPVEPPTHDRRSDQPQDDPDLMLRRQAERHRVGLPCGSEDCPKKECIDGFTIECTRRHRARRPCRSATCDIAICVAGRSTN
jgi:hypothetical protein